MSEKLSEMESFFMALADRTRLRLLNLMREGEICVCYFTAALLEPQPKISRHLAYLRQSGLVETTRVGKWVYYRLAELKDENAASVFSDALNWAATHDQMKADRERLVQINCCEPENMPDAIRKAPHAVEFAKADMSGQLVQIKREADREDMREARREDLADYLL